MGDRRTVQASTLFGRLLSLNVFDQNMACATLMMNLAAAALGLGAAWISIFEPAAEEMKPILGIPQIISLFALVPIGYPAIQPTPYRRELNELVHFEKYDMSKYRSHEEVQEFIRRLRELSKRVYPIK